MNLSLFTKSSQESNSRDNAGFRLFNSLDPRGQEVAKKKNISKPYQFYGIWLAQKLDDFDNLTLYIRLAKYQRKEILEHAISYISDYPNAKSKPRLFLWFLKDKLVKVPKKKKSDVKQLELIKKLSTKLEKPQISEAKDGGVDHTQYGIVNTEYGIGNKVESGELRVKSSERKGEINQDFKLKKETLESVSGASFEKDKVLGIFRVDFYSEELNCVLETPKQLILLSAKTYQKSKETFLRSKKIKYILIASPSELEKFFLELKK